MKEKEELNKHTKKQTNKQTERQANRDPKQNKTKQNKTRSKLGGVREAAAKTQERSWVWETPAQKKAKSAQKQKSQGGGEAKPQTNTPVHPWWGREERWLGI